MILLDRSRSGPDPRLPWKVGLFGGGSVLTLVGIGLESPWLVAAAILVLLGGAALRWLPGAGPGAGEEPEDDEEGDADRESGRPA